jgi:hypothetical protein
MCPELRECGCVQNELRRVHFLQQGYYKQLHCSFIDHSGTDQNSLGASRKLDKSCAVRWIDRAIGCFRTTKDARLGKSDADLRGSRLARCYAQDSRARTQRTNTCEICRAGHFHAPGNH